MLRRFAPWLAALVVLLAAWFVRLPDPVLGKDQLVAARMPETRTSVERARSAFLDAQLAYSDYVKSNDVAQMLLALRSLISRLKATGDTSSTEDPAHLTSYAGRLHQYASAGEAYFDTLKRYDDDLMAWTRSLGAVSESLRDDTFPIVEHLKLYPPPTGNKPDPPGVSASEVATQTASVEIHLNQLKQLPPVDETRRLAGLLQQDVDNLEASGRSIEYIESLHEQYYAFLKKYDGAVQATIAQGDTAQAPSPLALTLDVLVGALALVGIGALFMSGYDRTQPSQL